MCECRAESVRADIAPKLCERMWCRSVRYMSRSGCKLYVLMLRAQKVQM